MSASAHRSTSSSTAGLALHPAAGGTRLRLRVKPGARKSGIVGVHGGALKMSVAAPPEKGKANRAVIALLASVMNLPASAVAIVAGETAQDKVVEINLAPEAVRAIFDSLEDTRTP